MSEYTLLGKLPSGLIGQSLTRIRGTANSYCSALQDSGWLVSFKLATVQALERRLKNHDTNVVGKMDLELEQAYRQLVERVEALIAFYKSCRMLGEAKTFAASPALLVPLQPLSRYFGAIMAHLAPDIQIMMMYATFHLEFKATESLKLYLH